MYTDTITQILQASKLQILQYTLNQTAHVLRNWRYVQSYIRPHSMNFISKQCILTNFQHKSHFGAQLNSMYACVGNKFQNSVAALQKCNSGSTIRSLRASVLHKQQIEEQCNCCSELRFMQYCTQYSPCIEHRFIQYGYVLQFKYNFFCINNSQALQLHFCETVVSGMHHLFLAKQTVNTGASFAGDQLCIMQLSAERGNRAYVQYGFQFGEIDLEKVRSFISRNTTCFVGNSKFKCRQSTSQVNFLVHKLPVP